MSPTGSAIVSTSCATISVGPASPRSLVRLLPAWRIILLIWCGQRQRAGSLSAFSPGRLGGGLGHCSRLCSAPPAAGRFVGPLLPCAIDRCEPTRLSVRARRLGTKTRDAGADRQARSRRLSRRKSDTTPARLDRYKAIFLSNDPVSYGLASLALTEVDLEGSLQKLTVPCLFLAGRHDLMRQPDYVRRLAANTPNAAFAVLESGHIMSMQAPHEVARQIDRFCSSSGDRDRLDKDAMP